MAYNKLFDLVFIENRQLISQDLWDKVPALGNYILFGVQMHVFVLEKTSSVNTDHRLVDCWMSSTYL